ncbi:YmfQ family protein [Serratia nevei]|uniref:YmfQ family protein n=1 Tax=Serratia nevei TaxID=2703794 RepID=UPI003F6C9738
MGLTEQYKALNISLLPPGPAWSPKDPIMLGLAPSLAAVHQRADELMLEIDPRTTTELIDRYEALCGLPDSCAPPGVQTLRQRQQRLDAKINVAGGINEAFFLAQLAALGYPGATINKFQQATFRCTSTCTDAVFNDDWRFYWQVNMPTSATINSMTCISACNSSLRTWGETVAECVINKLCPSHTYVIFRYLE